MGLRLLTFDNLSTVEYAIADETRKGFDLVHAPFVSQSGTMFCQWVGNRYCNHVYRLATGFSLEHLETSARGLAEQGFDFVFAPVVFQGMYCQWMARWVDDGAFEVALQNASKIVTPIDLPVDMKVVVDVRPVASWGLLPGVLG